MGTLVYDQKVIADLDDRALAHLQVVVINKLRRQESFSISLQDAGKTISVWVSPHSALAFIFAGNRQPTLNRRWIEELAQTANSVGGLFMIPEPPFEDSRSRQTSLRVESAPLGGRVYVTRQVGAG